MEKLLYQAEGEGCYTWRNAQQLARLISPQTSIDQTQYAILLIAGGQISKDGADPLTHEFLDKVAKAWDSLGGAS